MGRFQLREKAHSGSDIFSRSGNVTKGFSGSAASPTIAWLDGVETFSPLQLLVVLKENSEIFAFDILFAFAASL
ncbi:hypothetical protein FCV25MIE_02072, partial [Fagus crenata]